jgi:hypothetical protein
MSGFGDVVCAFVFWDSFKKDLERVVDGFDGPSYGFSHGVFDLREELLDGVEARAVGRLEEEPYARGSDHLPDGLALVRP